MDLGIKGKIAVVTASSRGLGKAVAEALAAEGVNLAICSRDKQKIEETAHQLRTSYGVDVLPVACNVADRNEVTAFKEKVIDYFKTCHIVFANAGGPPPGKVEAFNLDDFQQALDLNLLSTIQLVNCFLPYMKEQKWGRILASTSISVKQPIPTLALSNVSRVGVVAFIKSLSADVGVCNVTANVLAPGFIMTERVENLLTDRSKRENISYKEAEESVLQSIPVRKIGSPAEFGALSAFLSSEHASYITGTTILIDGGMYGGLM
ncbi:MAG: SDR family oxidoreductase [bacterium]|nr:SDR family oxidoreductase [bacterium]